MSAVASSIPVVRHLRATAPRSVPVLAAAIASIGVGAAALVGWAFDIGVLRSVVPGLIDMKANTAVCFVLAGIALWIGPGRGAKGALRITCSAAMLLIAVATLVEHATGWDLGLDQALFGEQAAAAQALIPGRMGITTACCLALIAVSLAMLGSARRASQISTAVGMALAMCTTLLGLTTYLFSTSNPSGSVYTTMAINTAVLMVFVVVGVLWSSPDHGLPMLLHSPGPGGSVSRRLLPVAFISPVFFGWVVTHGVARGLLDDQYGRSLLVCPIVIVMCALILGLSKSLTLTHSQLTDALREAETDPVSGLYNRRAIDRRIAQLAPRDVVVVFDLDEFKQVNDRFGHAAGDDVLRTFADALVDSSRNPGDWFGRLGGDEFIAGLSAPIGGGVDRYLARLQQTWTGSPRLTTYSGGFATHDGSTGPRKVLARADEALYAAKTDGRDRVRSWAHLGTDPVGEAEKPSPPPVPALQV